MSSRNAALWMLSLLAPAWFVGAEGPTPTAAPAKRFMSLYERVAQWEKDEPGYMRRSAKDEKAVGAAAWLAGKWKCDVTVFATPTTAERKGGPPEEQEFERGTSGDLFEVKRTDGKVTRSPYLFYDPRARLWVAPMGEVVAWGVLTSPGWEGSSLMLRGRVSIMGSWTDLRQTLAHVASGHYTILNEEQAPDGAWVRLDWYDCTTARN